MAFRNLFTWSLCVSLTCAAGCDLPRDNEGTLDRVQGGTLRVGVAHNPPWVRFEGAEVSGIEPALLRDWAQRLGARIEWIRGSEADLAKAVQAGALDVVAAGLKSDTPWKSRLGLSQPYLKARIRFAVPHGAETPDNWDGRDVAVTHERIAILAMVSEEGATPVTQTTAGKPPNAVAFYDFEIEAGALSPAGPTLGTERHVLGARPGESAFLLALDRFLKEHDEAAMRRLAAAAAKP